MKKISIVFYLLLIWQVFGYAQEWNLDGAHSYEFNGTNLSTELPTTDWYRCLSPNEWHPLCFNGANSGLNWPQNGPAPLPHGPRSGEAQIYVDDGAHIVSGVSVMGRNCLQLIATQDVTTYNDIYNGVSVTCDTYDYRSAWIETTSSFGFGKFEICCKMPSGEGVFPAFWLYGEGATVCSPITGPVVANEIDVFEYRGSTTGEDIELNYRYYDTNNTNGICNDGLDKVSGLTYQTGMDLSQDFHVYSVEWTEDHMIWKIDGINRRIINRNTYPDMYPCQQMRIIVNFAVAPFCPGPNPNTFDPCATFPQSFDIDYIHVYNQSECESHVVCDNDPGDAPNATTQLSGYDIDLALGDDIYQYLTSYGTINYYGIENETYWTPCWADFLAQRNYTCDLNVLNAYDVQAENGITMHEGFTADANLFASSTDVFDAHIANCSSHSHSTNYSNRNTINSLHQSQQTSDLGNYVSLYPNPNTGIFTINFNNVNLFKKIEVINFLGETIQTLKLNQKELTYLIKLDNESKGIYFIKFISENGFATKKIIVE